MQKTLTGLRDAQADLSLRWSHMSECFCFHVEANNNNNNNIEILRKGHNH